MKALLDTHTFLWYIEGNSNLSDTAREAIESSENQLFFSIASLWEISIKLGLGKLTIQPAFQELEALLRQLNIELLPIVFADTFCYLSLPLHHRDPFDRILIAQSINNALTLISRDSTFAAYSVQQL